MTKHFKKTFFCLIFLSGFLAWGNAKAACTWVENTGTVASPYDHADVQACVTDAAGKTGAVTISIPACNVNWDDRALIDMSSGWANVTSLTIQGAGIASTIITDMGTDTTFNRARLFHFTSIAGKSIRLTGMSFADSSVSCSSTSGQIYIHGTGTENRIDHLDFADTTCTNISLHPSAEGLVDSCTFTNNRVGGNSIKPFGNGDASWTAQSFTPGTSHAWYIENNTFTHALASNGAYDAYNAARIVFRYNIVHGTGVGGHGNDSGNYSATHTQEIYNNTFDNTCGASECNNGTNISFAVDWRGGTGVMFSNTFDANINAPTRVENYRSNPYYEGTATNIDNSTTTLQDSTANFGSNVMSNSLATIYNQTKSAYCNVTGYTSTTITCSGGLSGGAVWSTGDKYMHTYYYNDDLMCDGLGPNDGNVAGQQGWPCKQQIGTTYDGGYTYKPVYAWDNNWNGSVAGHLANYPSNSTRSNTYHVKENLTYFNCDSAADCKSKTDAVDVPGFGYDQGWTYTSYTYPHPLRTEATDIVAPASPTGLSVQ